MFNCGNKIYAEFWPASKSLTEVVGHLVLMCGHTFWHDPNTAPHANFIQNKTLSILSEPAPSAERKVLHVTQGCRIMRIYLSSRVSWYLFNLSGGGEPFSLRRNVGTTRDILKWVLSPVHLY
jgi:hypothetical protein